uniref:Uncharacterized protein n=1 Tax=Ciona intestinalis TaxID=7719 RepID=F6T3R5_CIOIN
NTKNYAKNNQNIKKTAIPRNIRDNISSSSYCTVPAGGARGRPSATLNTDPNTPNGKAPMPNDI